jgi:hypothetical protein
MRVKVTQSVLNVLTPMALTMIVMGAWFGVDAFFGPSSQEDGNPWWAIADLCVGGLALVVRFSCDPDPDE